MQVFKNGKSVTLLLTMSDETTNPSLTASSWPPPRLAWPTVLRQQAPSIWYSRCDDRQL